MKLLLPLNPSSSYHTLTEEFNALESQYTLKEMSENQGSTENSFDRVLPLTKSIYLRIDKNKSIEYLTLTLYRMDSTVESMRFYNPKHIAQLQKLETAKDLASFLKGKGLSAELISNYINSAQLLIKKSPPRRNWVLSRAAKHGDEQVVTNVLMIKEVREHAHIGENRALCFAANNGHLPIVEKLLEIPNVYENVSTSDNRCLLRAILGKHVSVVKRLLEIKAVCDSVDVKDNKILLAAIRVGNPDILEYILNIPHVFKDALSKSEKTDFLKNESEQSKLIFMQVLNKAKKSLLSIDQQMKDLHIKDRDRSCLSSLKGAAKIFARELGIAFRSVGDIADITQSTFTSLYNGTQSRNVHARSAKRPTPMKM